MKLIVASALLALCTLWGCVTVVLPPESSESSEEGVDCEQTCTATCTGDGGVSTCRSTCVRTCEDE